MSKDRFYLEYIDNIPHLSCEKHERFALEDKKDFECLVGFINSRLDVIDYLSMNHDDKFRNIVKDELQQYYDCYDNDPDYCDSQIVEVILDLAERLGIELDE